MRSMYMLSLLWLKLTNLFSWKAYKTPKDKQ